MEGSVSQRRPVTRPSGALWSVLALICLGGLIVPRQTVRAEPGPTGATRYLVTDLGTLGGSHMVPFDINNAGQVVGWGNLTAKGPEHGFVWEIGRLHDIAN